MTRIKKLQKKLRKIDGLLVSNSFNLNYLTQTTVFFENSRDGFTLITKKSAYLFISCLIAQKNFPDIFDQIFTPTAASRKVRCNVGHEAPLRRRRSSTASEEEAPTLRGRGVFTLKKRNDLFRFLKTTLGDKRSVGFEANDLKYSEFEKLSEKLKAKLVPTKNLVENLRIIKDKNEIKKIKKACQITKKTFVYIKSQLKPGRTEKQIAWLMEKFIRQKGADDLAFPIIVASGPNSAIPHHQVSNRKLQKNDIILIDAGCKYEGYCSDMTRVFFIGAPKPEWQKIYKIVKTAQQKTIKTLNTKPLKANQLDRIARDYIKRKGFGKYFIHRTGHGLGLNIHEKPHIDKKSQQVLKPGMVFTIEPGIYLPGKFGIRIEDTFLL